MTRALLLACLLAPGLLLAADPTPTPAGDDAATGSEGEASDPAALAPVLREEVNLADQDTAGAFELPAPPDSPDPEKTGETDGPLPGDEDAPVRPAVTGKIEIGAGANGKTIGATVGQLVCISLEANPSTGYNWELRGFDYGAVDFFSSELVARKTGNVLFGAPGNAVFCLQAVQPGEQTVRLVYRRPWEPPDQIASSFEIRIVVKPVEP